MTSNRPTIIPPNDQWAVLPAHERTEDGVCSHCGDTPIWATYEEYLAHWQEFEYEGDPDHQPSSREEFEYIRDSCLG